MAGVWDRSNVALYVDLEADLTDKLLLGLAGRYEDFDTFGSTSNFKLSGLFRATDRVNLRFTSSTGFRAPTPGQGNISNISTVAGNDGVLFQKGTLAPTNPVSMAYGGEELQPEESTNLSFGMVMDVTDSFNVTIDAYSIELEDRITQGDDVSLTPADIANLTAQGIPGAGDLTNFRFYVNDFDTTTEGIDIVATYSAEMGNGTTDFTFVHSKTSTEVDKTSGLVGGARIGQLESLLPESRWNLTAVHNSGDWRVLARYNWIDEWIWWDIYSDPVFSTTVGDMSTLDLEVSRDLGEYTLTLGAQNITDEYPDNPSATLCCGMKYPEGSPFGFNGAFYYFKLGLDF